MDLQRHDTSGGPRRRAARVALGVAVCVLAAKALAWKLSGSVALQADAVESTVNVVAALGLMWAVRIASQPADEGHPWGHGKAEYLSSGIEGTLVAVAGAGIVFEAVGRLLSPTPLAEVGLGMAVALGAATANAVAGAWLVREGKRLGSPAIEADGRHDLADVATTVGSLVGLGAAVWFEQPWLDPLAALLVGLHVLRESAHILGDAVSGLMDAALPDAEGAALQATIVEAMGGDAQEFHDLRARRTAGHLHVDLHLVVPGTTSVSAAHAVCDAIEDAIDAAHGPASVNIHVEPEHEAHGDTSQG